MLKKCLLFIFVAFIAYKVQFLITFLGFHKTVYNHHPGPCKAVPGADHGSEDMAFIPGDKVLITSGLRFMERGNAKYSDARAGILLYDFNQPGQGAQPVAVKDFHRDLADCDFHGLSTFVDKDTGVVRVFIVNHLPASSVVELFEFDDKDQSLYYRETFGENDPNFRVLNDVVGVGPRQFYFTNCQYIRLPIEGLIQLRLGSVGYYDGTRSHIASEDRFLLPNGVATSLDGRYIFAALMADREIAVLEKKSDRSLTLKTRIPLYTIPDNIIVDPDSGDLLVGCHSVGHKCMGYLGDPSLHSPSQILRLRLNADGELEDLTEVFSDDGRLISGSSVGVMRKGQLLIGTMASNMVHCHVKYA